MKFDGKVQVAVTNIVLDEKVALAFDIPPSSKGPVTFFLKDGKAFYMNNDKYESEWILEWIS